MTDIEQANRELAQRLNDEALADPASPYAGKFVGIVNGEVVATGEKLGDVAGIVRQRESDPNKTFIMKAGVDYSRTVYIWSLD